MFKEVVFKDLVLDLRKCKEGKIKATKIVEKYPEVTLRTLEVAEEWELSEECIAKLENAIKDLEKNKTIELI